MLWSGSMLKSDRWLSQPRKDGPVYLRLSYPALDDPAKICRYRASLGTNDMDQARKIRNKYIVPILSRLSSDVLACRKILVHFLHEIDAAMPDLPRELDEALGISNEVTRRPTAVKLAALIEDYTAKMFAPTGSHTTALATAKRYRGIYRRFLANVGNVPIPRITTADVQAYADSRVDVEGASKKSVDLEITALRRLFKYAVKTEQIKDNPGTGVEVERTPAERRREKRGGARRPPTHEEMDRICSDFPMPPRTIRFTCEDFQDLALIARYTAMRQQEITNLKGKDFIEQGDILCINVADDDERTTKTGMQRLVPVANRLRPVIDRRRPSTPEAPLFPQAYDDNGKYFGKLFCRLVKNVASDIVLHGFRHYANSEMANAGVENDVRKQILGHARTDTHDGYTHFDVAILKRSVDKIY